MRWPRSDAQRRSVATALALAAWVLNAPRAGRAPVTTAARFDPTPVAAAGVTHGAPTPDVGVAPSGVSEAPRAGPGRAFTFRLRHGVRAPDARPNAWAYVPATLDVQGALRVVVVFHGFKNCIRSYVSDDGKRCAVGRVVRTGYDVAAQVDRSGARAIVVVPELAYDTTSSAPGELGEPGGLRAFLRELLDDALAPALGSHAYDRLAGVTLMASSGGYQALFPALEAGGVDAVDEVVLLDALYADAPAVDRFLARPRTRRFTLVYSEHGPQARRASEAFAARLAREHGAEWLHEPEVTDEALRAKVVVAATPLIHDRVVRAYLWRVLAAVGR